MTRSAEGKLVLFWLGSALVVTLLRLLNAADLGYDLTLQIQAAQNLLSGKGLSSYWAATDDLASPLQAATLTHWPCGYSLCAAALIGLGASVGTVVKVLGAAGTLLGWWGWAKLACHFFGEGLSRGPVWKGAAYSVALLTPLLFTPPWQGTDIFLWAAIPWILIWLDRASAAKASGVSWYDVLAGAVCGGSVLMRYASVLLAVYAAFLILGQTRLNLRLLLRRWGAFLGGLLPLMAVQIYVNYFLSNVHVAGGITFDRGAGAALQRIGEGLWLLSAANVSVAFWMPGKVLRALTQTADRAPWVLGVTLGVVALPWVLARKRGCGWLGAFRDVPVAAAGLLVATPAFLWACMMFGEHLFVADQRYYYPLIPMAILIAYALALPQAGAQGKMSKLVRTGGGAYLTGAVFMGLMGVLLMLRPSGFERRTKLMGTFHFNHWPSAKVNYEYSEARRYVMQRLKEEPDIILLTNLEEWFYADATVDQTKVHNVVPCDRLRATYLGGPAHLLILARDQGGRPEELQCFHWSVEGRPQPAECFERLPDLRLLQKFPEERLKILEARVPMGTRVSLREEKKPESG